MTNDDHNPRTPRQMPYEMRLGIARRHNTFSLRWLLLAATVMAALLATYGFQLAR